MNNLKSFSGVLIIVVSILAGCSDQITSSSDHTTNPGSSGVPKNKVSESAEKLSLKSFNTQIRLKPFRSYTFTKSNTGLDKINGIDVINLSDDPYLDKRPIECENLLVYGDSKDDAFIHCSSKGLDLGRITVENTSAQMLDLDVFLQGVREKKATESE